MRHHDEVSAFVGQKIPAQLRGALAAEDICQEAYVTVVQRLGGFTYQGDKSFLNWLLTIAERKLIDSIRAQRAAKRGGDKRVFTIAAAGDASSVIAILEQVAVHERTPSRSAATHELAQAVQHALAELKEDYRTALRYRFLEGLSAAETADRMARTEGAVLKLCERGLHRLSERIGDASRFFSRKA